VKAEAATFQVKTCRLYTWKDGVSETSSFANIHL